MFLFIGSIVKVPLVHNLTPFYIRQFIAPFTNIKSKKGTEYVKEQKQNAVQFYLQNALSGTILANRLQANFS